MKKHAQSYECTILRYAGDLADVVTLVDEYGAGESIAAIEQEHRLRGKHPWDTILADAIPLSPSLVARLHTLVARACDKVGLSCTLQLFTAPSPQINAYAFLDRYARSPILFLCLTSSAIEELTDPELLFLIGHELGHIVYEHDRINLLCHTDEHAPGATILPFMGEWLFLRWRQKAEISADRMGWLVSGRTDDCARVIIKAATGLSDRNLTLDTAAIHAFLQEAPVRQCHGKRPDSHSIPLLPARLKALGILTATAPEEFCFGTTRPSWLKKADRSVDTILAELSQLPESTTDRACMYLIADAGIQLVQGDNSVLPEEVKKVLNILHCHYSDQPDKLIEMDAKKRLTRMKLAIRTLNRAGSTQEKHEVLSRLTDIAIVDGCFLEKEGMFVVDLATTLHIPQAETYSIIVGCIQAKGHTVDPTLLSLVRKLS